MKKDYLLLADLKWRTDNPLLLCKWSKNLCSAWESRCVNVLLVAVCGIPQTQPTHAFSDRRTFVLFMRWVLILCDSSYHNPAETHMHRCHRFTGDSLFNRWHWETTNLPPSQTYGHTSKTHISLTAFAAPWDELNIWRTQTWPRKQTRLCPKQRTPRMIFITFSHINQIWFGFFLRESINQYVFTSNLYGYTVIQHVCLCFLT